MKKQLILTVVFMAAFLELFGQTNTFPPTGNVGAGTKKPNPIQEVKEKIPTPSLDPVSNPRGNSENVRNDVDNRVGRTNIFPPRGNVGIGTLNPQRKLDVIGADTWTARFQNGLGYIDFGPDNAEGAHIYTNLPQFIFNQPITLAGETSRISAHDSHSLVFNTGSSDRLTILSNGNVGIGTPDPTVSFQVEGNTKLMGNLEILGSNIRIDGAGKWTGNAESYTEINSNTNGQFLRQLANDGNTESWVIRGYAADGVQAHFNQGGINVNGAVKSKEVNVTYSGWADHVFDPGHELMSLDALKAFLSRHRHLPGIPTEKEVEENGVNLGEINVKLLEKIEELTLYVIQQEERINEQQNDIDFLKSVLNSFINSNGED